MNKYQEALNEMYAVLNDSNRFHKQKDLLQELVDKATGQKKHIENCKDREYLNHNYCYVCGQKLDWSDDD